MSPKIEARRVCQDWIRSYADLTKTQESPPLFHMACGLFALSAALGRKVWLNRGFYKTYPNIYVMLVAGSALCRKTAAINIAESMLLEAIPNISLVAQRITPEALITTLNEYFAKTGRSEAVIVAEELGVFLGPEASNLPMVQLLTKLYNCQDKMSYRTISRGNEMCENTWCCLLGGTTPEWLRTSLPKTAVEGGFTGRVLFIYQSNPLQRVFQPKLDEELYQGLAIDLRQISELEGEVTYSEEALEFTKNWYEKIYQPGEGDVKMDGYFGRKHDTVLKVAILLGVSRGNSLVLEKPDVVAAIAILEEIEKHMGACFRALQMSDSGEAVRQVRRIILRAGKEGIERSKLMTKVSYKYRAVELDSILDTLVDMGSVERTVGGNTGKVRIYRCVEETADDRGNIGSENEPEV